MKIALVHDYLVQDGGAERVLLAMHQLFPTAPIYTLFHDSLQIHPTFTDAVIHTSTLQKLPGCPKRYQWYLPWMPHAIEAFDFSGYDVVLSNSSSFAKGVIVPPETLHICYCHTPTRFLWQERIGYLNDLPQPKLIKHLLPIFLHRLRQWDYHAAHRPDILITNSHTSRLRIRRYYRREATVIHPPVDTHLITPSHGPGQHWLTGGRLVAYKRFDLVIRACTKLGVPLVVFGHGPEDKKLRSLAGKTITFVGRVSDLEKTKLYQQAIAFLHPQQEDFGITAVEAMAAGRPVIALGSGGATETVENKVSGLHVEVQCMEDLAEAIRTFDPCHFDVNQVRAHAERFSVHNFQEQLQQAITNCLTHHREQHSLCGS